MIKEENRRIIVTVPIKIYEMIKADAEYDDRSKSYIAAKILKKHYNYKSEDD